MSTFSQGLAVVEGDIFRSLAKMSMINYNDVLGREEKYINMEEVQQARNTEPNSAHQGTSQLKSRNPPLAP